MRFSEGQFSHLVLHRESLLVHNKTASDCIIYIRSNRDFVEIQIAESRLMHSRIGNDDWWCDSGRLATDWTLWMDRAHTYNNVQGLPISPPLTSDSTDVNTWITSDIQLFISHIGWGWEGWDILWRWRCTSSGIALDISQELLFIVVFL